MTITVDGAGRIVVPEKIKAERLDTFNLKHLGAYPAVAKAI
jgi:hypothetical protein